MKIDISKKVVLVTGGSSGIGKSCVKAFCESGAQVYFTYNTNAENAAKIATEHSSTPYKCNVSLEEQCEKVMENIISSHGKIDILVNNAGIYMSSFAGDKSFMHVWRTIIDINLNACACFANLAVPYMKKNGSGKIINISSIHAAEGSSGASAYHSSKAGLDGLTRALAIELAPFNIQVNSIGPGPIRTPMWGDTSTGYAKKIAQMVPARRFGEPDEIAYAALFLASDKANYITGQSRFIDGGILINVYKE